MLSLAIVSLFCVAAFVAGAAGRVLYPELEQIRGATSENVLLHMFQTQFPGILSGVFLAAAMAALMSSADSWVLVSSSGIARDIYQNVLVPNASEQTLLRVARYATAAVAVLEILTALKPRSILWAVCCPGAGPPSSGRR